MKTSLIALAATLMVSGHASALTFNDPVAGSPVNLNIHNGGTFDEHDALSFSVNISNKADGTAKTFLNYFTFTISDPFSNLIASGFETPIVFGGTTYTEIDPFNVTFYNMGIDNAIGGGDDVSLGGSSIDLVVPGGKYYMRVSGTTGGTGFIGGAYAGSVSVSPIPEPETWAMLLAGVGLVGLQLRRKIASASKLANG